MAKSKTEYVCASTLKNKYHLSASWVKRLGDPDKVVPNPHYRSGSEMYLYEVQRVKDFIDENREEYDGWVVKRQKMVDRALQRADEKRKTEAADERIARGQIKAWFKRIDIKVRAIPEDIWQIADAAYQDWYGMWYEGMGQNGLISYIRHELTNYEALLDELEELSCDEDGKTLVRVEVGEDWRGRPVYARTSFEYFNRLRGMVNRSIQAELDAMGMAASA